MGPEETAARLTHGTLQVECAVVAIPYFYRHGHHDMVIFFPLHQNAVVFLQQSLLTNHICPSVVNLFLSAFAKELYIIHQTP